MRARKLKFHHGSLKEAAAALAEEDLQAVGERGLSLDHLADRLGVTRPALYHHFANRTALLQEVTARGYRRFERELDAAVLRARDARAVLLALGEVYVTFAQRNPGWFRLQFSRTATDHPAPHHTGTPAHLPVIFGALESIVGRERRRVEQAYLQLWSTLHGIAVFLVERIPTHVATEQERLALARRQIRLALAQLSAWAETRRKRGPPRKRQ